MQPNLMPNSSPIAPEPQLSGDPSRETPPRLGLCLALTVGGIAAPLVCAWLVGNVLHLWRVNHWLPWAIQFAVTVLSLGCEVGAVVLGWRVRSVGVRITTGVAAVAALLLLLFAGAGVGMLVSVLSPA